MPVPDHARPRVPRRAEEARPSALRRPRGDGPGAGPWGPTDGARGRSRRVRPRGVPVLLVLLVAVLFAGALGLMGRITTEGPFRGAWEFSRLGGPWLVGAFVAGALGGWRRGAGGLVLGTVAGAITIALGSVAYYAIPVWFDGDTGLRRAAVLGVGWGAAGVVVGGAVGLLGACFSTRVTMRVGRDGRARGSWLHGAALGVLGGLLMGESIALLWVWEQPGLRAMATLEGVAGAVIVAAGAAARARRFVIAAVVAAGITAAVAPVLTTGLRDALRTIGWAGA
ncbi:hypothetical protein [Patulibacter americanus]|uniref:hypothetical protein n=1 Tax=Patulibacter americanus TaxID=588672 RepID=UPI0003B57FFC|nr:hypothetical protein [Patulibacter americanus]